MDSHAATRVIESAATTKSLKIRFFAIQNGTDIWIDGLEYEAFGSSMESYLRIHCGMSAQDSEDLGESNFEVIATDGFAEDLCLSAKGFDWNLYSTINELLNTYDEDVITAAKDLGIPFAEIEDKYRGKFSSFAAFAEETFNELSRFEIPEAYWKFIDYDKVAEDYEQQYSVSEGHVFDAC